LAKRRCQNHRTDPAGQASRNNSMVMIKLHEDGEPTDSRRVGQAST